VSRERDQEQEPRTIRLSMRDTAVLVALAVAIDPEHVRVREAFYDQQSPEQATSAVRALMYTLRAQIQDGHSFVVEIIPDPEDRT
jgi:hypothetical protein